MASDGQFKQQASTMKWTVSMMSTTLTVWVREISGSNEHQNVFWVDMERERIEGG